ncbi:MAG: ECF transporter S component [Cyanobacteria bacterium J06638_22]
MRLSDRLQRDFSTTTLALIPVAIVLNLVLGQTISLLKLPLFLDSLGTVLVAILSGPWAAAVTGLLTNLLGGFIDPFFPAFAPVAIVVGLVAGFCAKAGWFRAWWKVTLTGLLVGLAATLVATPIRVFLFGGVTGSGSSFFIAYLLATGNAMVQSVFAVTFLSNLLDKVITAIMCWIIVLRLSRRYISRFPRAENVLSIAGTPKNEEVLR